MATIRVCDRCLSTPVDEKTAYAFSMQMRFPDGKSYVVEEVELDADCAEVVLNLAKKMCLGPDATPGGVRKMKRSKGEDKAETKKPPKTPKAQKEA